MFLEETKCNGILDCPNGFDELFCGESPPLTYFNDLSSIRTGPCDHILTERAPPGAEIAIELSDQPLTCRILFTFEVGQPDAFGDIVEFEFDNPDETPWEIYRGGYTEVDADFTGINAINASMHHVAGPVILLKYVYDGRHSAPTFTRINYRPCK
jgi:hypothetical protein